MNLANLVQRMQRPLEKELIKLEGKVARGSHRCDGYRMRGLGLGAGAKINLLRFLEYNEFQCLPRDLNWAVAGVFSTWLPSRESLRLSVWVVEADKPEVLVSQGYGV